MLKISCTETDYFTVSFPQETFPCILLILTITAPQSCHSIPTTLIAGIITVVVIYFINDNSTAGAFCTFSLKIWHTIVLSRQEGHLQTYIKCDHKIHVKTRLEYDGLGRLVKNGPTHVLRKSRLILSRINLFILSL